MTEMLIRHVDPLLVERLRSLARRREWSINEVLLHVLRRGLGLEAEAGEGRTVLDDEGIVLHDGSWDDAEEAAFEAALQAFEHAPRAQLAEREAEFPEEPAGDAHTGGGAP